VRAPRGFLGRSALLLAMAACLPVDTVAAQRRALGEIEEVLQHLWALAPDLASQETRDAVTADVRSRCETSGASIVGACAALRVLLDRWVNGGRSQVVVYDEPARGDRWRARVTFNGPGSYIAHALRVTSEGVGEGYQTHGLPTYSAALQVATDDARRLQMRADSEFTRRYGICDDLVKQDPPPTAEQQAKMDRWYQETLAKRPPLPISRGEWHPEDAADRARAIMSPDSDTLTPAKMREAVAQIEKHAIPKNEDGMYRVPRFDDPEVRAHFAVLDRISERAQREEAAELGMREAHERADMAAASPPPETDFERAQRMAFNTSADKAFERMRPMNRLRREVLYEPKIEPAPPRPDWPPRYSAKPKPRKPPKDPELRAEQRQRKAAKAKKRARRGWS
jgi:hypothetical protein